MGGESGISKQGGHRVYGRRWLVLVAVTLLNLANYSHWISFAAVAKHAAQFYQVSGPEVDLIPTLSYGLCIPFCLVAVYIVERCGLRAGLLLGACLTAFGGAICCLATLPEMLGQDWWDRSVAFKLTVLGQALTGIGCPFISCVPTKVSQNWFGESERTLATLILGMSNPLGLVLGQSLTPLLVTNASHIPLLNLVWFLPSIPGFLLTLFGVRSSLPPTPPSKSAASAMLTKRRPFLGTIWKLARNPPFIIVFLFLGGAMGYISTLQTKLEQMLCSRGYSDQLAGLCAAAIIVAGFLASFPTGYIAMKTGRLTTVAKVGCVPAVLLLGVMTWVLVQPGLKDLVLVSCILLGVASLGIYPVMLELSVECTFPLDESVVTGLCYLSSALQGVLLMFVENLFDSPLTDPVDLDIQTCRPNQLHSAGDGLGYMEPKDYSNYIIFINVYMILLILAFFFFFRTDYKRSKMNKMSTNPEELKEMFSPAAQDQNDNEKLEN